MTDWWSKFSRFCHSSLAREVAESLAFRLFAAAAARPTEVGARTLVHGASAGPESHGQYVPDCKIAAVKGLASDSALQGRVWKELRSKLEGIRPGITSLS